MNEPAIPEEQPAATDQAALLARVVSARDAYANALAVSLRDGKGNIQLPLLEMLIVQRIEKMKLKCLMEVLGESVTDAVLQRFVAELEAGVEELGKPQIARAVDHALRRNGR
jgi:hypothetical protein